MAGHAKKCSAKQMSYVMRVRPNTITYLGQLDPAFALNIDEPVICAGSYETSQTGADFPQLSIAFVPGGTDSEAVFSKLGKLLRKEGFPNVVLSGAGTHPWDDGHTSVTASRLDVVPGTEKLYEVPAGSIGIMAVPSKA
jgi:hypothetical protein